MRTFQAPGMNGGLTLELTSDGGFIGTGQHESSGAGSCDLYVYKVDECGNPQWFFTYGGPAEDGGKCIKQTSDGGYILAGLAKLGAGDYDNWLVKLSPTGALQWSKVIGGGAADYGLYVIQTNDGGYIMSGFIQGFGWGGTDAILTKTDSLGNIQWTKIYGGADGDWGDCVIQAADSGFYVSGYTRSFGAGNGELWLFKVDKNGTLQWSNAYGGGGEDGDQSWGIEAVLTTGSSIVFAGNTTNWGAGSNDILMLKTDLNGNLIWAKTYGGAADDQPRTILQTKTGGFAIAGWTTSFGFGDKDAYLVVTDSAGNLLWSKTYGGAAYDKGMGLRQAADSGFAMSILTASFGANYYDPVFMKTDSVGNVSCNVSTPATSVSAITPTVTPGGLESAISPAITSPSVSVGTYTPSDNYLCYGCNIVPQITVNDTAMCEGDTIYFYNATPTGKKCVQWFVEGASYGYGDSIGTAFYAPGIYHINLVANCGNATDTAKVIITIYPRSVPNFTFNDECLYQFVTFLDSSQGNIIAWQYDFGDGNVPVNLQNVSHAYSSSGLYNVKLQTMTNFGCVDSVTKTVEIFPVPNAVFNTANVCLYDTAFFTDSSTVSSGSITNWNWNFADSNTDTVQNPSHQYNVPATYNVQLITTSDHLCKDTANKNLQIYFVPAANFVTVNTCLYNPAQFTDQSTLASGNIVTWQWNFGTATSSAPNPSYQYLSDGTDTVQLIVISDNGCSDTIAKTITVYPVPVAAFSDSNVCKYSNAIFIDSSSVSSGTVSTWQWNFGDGTSTSPLQNPPHLYSAEGSYTVQLVATTNNGCSDTISHPVQIYAVPIAGFTTANICIYDSAKFTDKTSISSGSFTWTWNFGDSSSASSVPNPSHLYSAYGNYFVQLLVTSNNNCVDSVSQSIYVNPQPNAFFSSNPPNKNCLYDTSFFNNASTISSGNIAIWSWDFDDGASASSMQNPEHAYSSAGIYNVSLITISDSGCSDTTIVAIEKYPVPTADFSPAIVCLHDSTQFTDLSTISGDSIVSWIWNFGDFTPLVNQQNPFHYFALGSYNVTLIVVSDLGGCIDDSTKQVGVYPLPVAVFNDSNSCINKQPTIFLDTSFIQSGTVTGWQWDFGDGATDTIKNPQHFYQTDSTYTVHLTVTSNNGCIDDTIKQVVVYPLPQFSFASSPDSGCKPLCVTFVGYSLDTSVNISGWSWNFDDGNTSSQQPVQYCYADEGDYIIGLTAITDKGCRDTVINDTIAVFPKPIPGFSSAPQPTTIFNPKIIFTDASNNAVGWHWDFGDLPAGQAGNSSDSVQFPVHTYKDTGTYTVQQIVTNQYGCKDTITGVVYISPEYVIYIPNAFTPDGDRKNDYFIPVGIGIDPVDFAMYIYDRWGEIIYQTLSLSNAWDGKVKGEDAKQDVYVYLIVLKDVFGEPHSYRGQVTLLR